MQTEIRDDFDPEKISESGQCFRVKKWEDGTYRFVSGDHVLYLKKTRDGVSFSCPESEWNSFWFDYFDLGRNYREICDRDAHKNAFIDQAMAYGRGLRILRQDPWEVLITFIISQRKNIPAIAKSVEMLALAYGHPIVTERETLYAFPSPAELAEADEESLRACSLGYRASYVLDAVSRVRSGSLDLAGLSSLSDEQLLAELQRVRGVGKKVANCVALFGYARTESVPVDVWITRAIEEDCAGVSPFEQYREDAGIMQQYAFFYERNHRGRGAGKQFAKKSL